MNLLKNATLAANDHVPRFARMLAEPGAFIALSSATSCLENPAFPRSNPGSEGHEAWPNS